MTSGGGVRQRGSGKEGPAEDNEFEETIGNAGRKLETPMAPVMPWKICKKNKKEIYSKTNGFKTKFASILEASESTSMRMEISTELP